MTHSIHYHAPPYTPHHDHAPHHHTPHDLPSPVSTGFDEFPAPLQSWELMLLEKEVQRLHKAHRTLSQALHYYSKQKDKAKHHLEEAKGRLVAFDSVVVPPADPCDAVAEATAESHQPAPVHSDTPTAPPLGTPSVPVVDAPRKRPRDDDDAPGDSSCTSTTAPTVEDGAAGGVRRRRFTQSAALLAGMQKMIAANQRRDVATGIGGAAVRLERDRIAKEAKRNVLLNDVTAATDVYANSSKAVRELEEKLGPLRTRMSSLSVLLDNAEVHEADYISAFFIRVSGAKVADEEPPACNRSGNDGSDDAEPTANDGPVREAASGVVDCAAAEAYEIFFLPAQHSDTTKEAIRLQVYDVLDAYLSHRSLIDPVLTSIKEAREVSFARRRQPPHHGHQQGGWNNNGGPPQRFIPMSPEEASSILRNSEDAAVPDAPKTAVTVSTPRSSSNAAAADGNVPDRKIPELEWSVYESAMAALDDFE